MKRPPEYVQVQPQGSGPTYLGPDENGRHRFSFTVQLEYVAAVAPGMVVPLSGEAGVLCVPSLPLADFPRRQRTPEGCSESLPAGALLLGRQHLAGGAARVSSLIS